MLDGLFFHTMISVLDLEDILIQILVILLVMVGARIYDGSLFGLDFQALSFQMQRA